MKTQKNPYIGKDGREYPTSEALREANADHLKRTGRRPDCDKKDVVDHSYTQLPEPAGLTDRIIDFLSESLPGPKIFLNPVRTEDIPRDPKGYTMRIDPETGRQEIVLAVIPQPGDPDYERDIPNTTINAFTGPTGKRCDTLGALRADESRYASMFLRDIPDRGIYVDNPHSEVNVKNPDPLSNFSKIPELFPGQRAALKYLQRVSAEGGKDLLVETWYEDQAREAERAKFRVDPKSDKPLVDRL